MDNKKEIEKLTQKARELIMQGKFDEPDRIFDEIENLKRKEAVYHPTIRPEIMDFAIEMEKEMAKETNSDWFYLKGNETKKHNAIQQGINAMLSWHKAKGE